MAKGSVLFIVADRCPDTMMSATALSTWRSACTMHDVAAANVAISELSVVHRVPHNLTHCVMAQAAVTAKNRRCSTAFGHACRTRTAWAVALLLGREDLPHLDVNVLCGDCTIGVPSPVCMDMRYRGPLLYLRSYVPGFVFSCSAEGCTAIARLLLAQWVTALLCLRCLRCARQA